MKKQRYTLLSLFILASVIGIYAQDLAYLINDQFSALEPMTNLVILTVLSVVLYLVYIIRSLFLYKKKGSPHQGELYVIIISTVLAILISFWSLFVLAMWWG